MQREASVEVGLRWIASAKSHFNSASMLNAPAAPEWTQVVYHCQQTAERALKALHQFAGLAAERVHDLDRLRLSLLDKAQSSPISPDDAQWLTSMFAAHRYAEIDPSAQPLTEHDINRALSIARACLDAAEAAAAVL